MDDQNMHAYGDHYPDEAEIGRRWYADSSLEAWFPITAEEIKRLRTENAALKKTLEALKVGTCETAKPAAWIRFCSDGSYEGPLADCDKRMDEVRRKSGAWTPLFATPNDGGQRSDD